jgi:hypothetical protein
MQLTLLQDWRFCQLTGTLQVVQTSLVHKQGIAA